MEAAATAAMNPGEGLAVPVTRAGVLFGSCSATIAGDATASWVRSALFASAVAEGFTSRPIGTSPSQRIARSAGRWPEIATRSHC